MFQTAPGVTIPFPDKIQEQFQVYEGKSIYANISFEKLKPILTEFYHNLPEPLFIVLQLPLSIHEERKLKDSNTFHQEVCYLDGQTKSQIDDIIEKYGQILLEDGMSQFAVASHVNNEEIFIQKYKLTAFYSSSPRRFIPFLQRYGLTETDNLITVWNTFSQETPGECRRVSINGFDVYDVAEQLKKQGLYRAKIIES
ncbi:MAG: hypothetical protein MSA01_07105 [Anaeromassilibacillus sp.]|nr:hypothetical protein [Anaeromassilibacillus sp.]MDY3779724.1 hypothetical protein [Candidatus Limousia pullorum]